MLYKMMDVCRKSNISYETLKFYCNKGLIPNVKRDKNNHRIFDEYDLNWIKDVICLKRCGMSIAEIKKYMQLCLEGEKTIVKRKNILEESKQKIEQQISLMKENLKYIEKKENLYTQLQRHEIPYRSNLLKKK
ncbi:MerR family transcriptional regulator [Lactobacillus sp. ESL0791]|uniref:MerR family transcriptional regulator n=1 Tax=Lactobacillus sp. ESL0791 TaxID=2983234 RepID=UPI0023F88152|nr:MerR family transcriptional regulator [Lactobacillus sp. ESL0791]MDF7639382.1 MerR family transcriptional regulator [Lactobacillus sp. ESL0791]